MGSWCGGSSSKYGPPAVTPYGTPYGGPAYGAPAYGAYGPPVGVAPGPGYAVAPVGTTSVMGPQGPVVPVGPPQFVGYSPNPPPGYTSGRSGCC